MELIVWIIVGVFAGWLTSALIRRERRNSLFSDAILGILGAFAAGLVLNLYNPDLTTNGVFIAVGGAVVVIFFGRILRYRQQ